MLQVLKRERLQGVHDDQRLRSGEQGNLGGGVRWRIVSSRRARSGAEKQEERALL